MLVLCYGFPKSGSTLAFQLARGVLISAGYSQDSIPGPYVRHPNFLYGTHRDAGVFQTAISDLLSAIGKDRTIAVKTHEPAHSALFPWLESLQQSRQLQVIVSYRDPRDMSLSLVDAGERARKRGARPFSEIKDLEDAARTVERRIPQFRLWAALKGAVRLYYDTVAFAPDEAIDAIENALDVRCNREAAKKYAFCDARTLKNKCTPDRHKTELSPDQQVAFSERFREFIEKACRQNDDAWFSEFRIRMIEKAATRKERGPIETSCVG